jgi:hypothetical protein
VLKQNANFLVETVGIEPTTPCLQSRCSPSWAMPPSCLPSIMVGLGRLELPTSPLSGVRSNHLSYRPALTILTSFNEILIQRHSVSLDYSFASFFAFLSLFLPSNKCGYLRQLLSLDIFVRRWSSHRFPYGYLVTTSPQSWTIPW